MHPYWRVAKQRSQISFTRLLEISPIPFFQQRPPLRRQIHPALHHRLMLAAHLEERFSVLLAIAKNDGDRSSGKLDSTKQYMMASDNPLDPSWPNRVSWSH
jgi:hypothetical protein